MYNLHCLSSWCWAIVLRCALNGATIERQTRKHLYLQKVFVCCFFLPTKGARTTVHSWIETLHFCTVPFDNLNFVIKVYVSLVFGAKWKETVTLWDTRLCTTVASIVISVSISPSFSSPCLWFCCFLFLYCSPFSVCFYWRWIVWP